MKRFVFCVGMLLIGIPGLVIAETPAKNRTNEKNREQPAAVVVPAGRDSYLIRAQRLFTCGNLIEADSMVRKSLKARPLNPPALEFQKKIARVTEQIEQGKRGLAQDYYASGEHLFREGFVLDAMLD